jgi:hypothetical protein
MPPRWGLLLGDALHNVRCALDHMAWHLVVIGALHRGRSKTNGVSASPSTTPHPDLPRVSERGSQVFPRRNRRLSSDTSRIIEERWGNIRLPCSRT